MSPAEKIKSYTRGGRRYWLIQTYADDPHEGCHDASELIWHRCPKGYHPHRVKIEKDSKGRRASVQVWFRENLRRREE